MARKHNLEKAVAAFEQGAYSAGDGAIVDAGVWAAAAIGHLEREWKRRRPLRAGTPYLDMSLGEAINGEIARRLGRKKQQKAVA